MSDQERDIVEIDLNHVTIKKIDPEWNVSPKGRPRGDYEELVRDLQALQSRFGGSSEHQGAAIERLKESPDEQERRLYACWKEFYGPGAQIDKIRVAWDERAGTLVPENGNHRLWVAKAAGMARCPAVLQNDDRRIRDMLSERGIVTPPRVATNRDRIPLWKRQGPDRDDRITRTR